MAREQPKSRDKIFEELLRQSSVGGGKTEEQRIAEENRRRRASWLEELRELNPISDPTPAQLRRIAEIVEALEGDAVAREHWERAAAAGDRDARDYLVELDLEAAEKERRES